jgi:2'-5' RNA ligase
MKDSLRSLIAALRAKTPPAKPPPPDYASRVYVLAHFVQDHAYKKAQKIAQDTANYNGMPVALPHLTLAYFGDVTDLNILLNQVEKELRKLRPFSVTVQGLELMPHRSLWLTVSKTTKLRNIADHLADIVLWCGFSHRGFPMRNWIPHILLAKFPPESQLKSDALPWDIKNCKHLMINELLITHQLNENDFETLVRIPLKAEKPTKPVSKSTKPKTTRPKSTRKKK